MNKLKHFLRILSPNSSLQYDDSKDGLVVLTKSKQKIVVPKNSRLQDVLPPSMFSCRKGRCGTCVVIVQKGMENLSARTKSEPQVGLKRKACQVQLLQGEVRLKK